MMSIIFVCGDEVLSCILDLLPFSFHFSFHFLDRCFFSHSVKSDFVIHGIALCLCIFGATLDAWF